MSIGFEVGKLAALGFFLLVEPLPQAKEQAQNIWWILDIILLIMWLKAVRRSPRQGRTCLFILARILVGFIAGVAEMFFASILGHPYFAGLGRMFPQIAGMAASANRMAHYSKEKPQ